MRVPYVNFPAQFAEQREDVLACVEAVFGRGDFVGGGAVEELEKALTEYCGVEHAVALNSGTDALILAMKALGIGPGDAVISPPNSFVASTAAIVAVGAQPVFADVGADQNIDPDAIERAITPTTKAIMPVHLTGRIADMDAVLDIARRHGLKTIEDAAQSIGSKYHGKTAGSLGDVGCFSAHPLKNLNAAGDAGFVTTDDAEIASRIRLLRNHGLRDRETVVEWGTVSRLDTFQAALLSMRLEKLEGVIERRRANADRYRRNLEGCGIEVPICRNHEFNTFHTFVIQLDPRDALRDFLRGRGIETGIHYPIPIHLQPAAQDLGYGVGDFPVVERQAKRILTLPIHQYMSQGDIDFVSDSVREFPA